MNRLAIFCAGVACASFAPSIVGERSLRAEAASAVREDDKSDKSDKAEAAARKLKKVEEALGAMNQKAVSELTLEASVETFSEMGLPEGFGECFKENFDIDHVLAFTAEIYADALEESTVDALIAFYKTDEGKALAKALPGITVESFKKGAEYGKKVGQECAQGR